MDGLSVASAESVCVCVCDWGITGCTALLPIRPPIIDNILESYCGLYTPSIDANILLQTIINCSAVTNLNMTSEQYMNIGAPR